jgi:peptidoglycan-N-acetylglucosamine deacetylase
VLNTDACARKVESKLFRPPYGRIGFRQLRALRSKGYQIMMWDILTRDYDQQTDIPAALKAILQHTDKGSIVVFHDSLKAAPQLKQLLPRVLETLQNRGYQFLPLAT